MASYNAPATPEKTPRNAQTGIGRSFTLPTRLAASATTTSPASPAEAEIGAADGIETLYVHLAAKVVKFAPSAGRSVGRNAGTDRAEAGTLPWASSTERTLASGPLEIYRVPGSVSFIHSGSLLHAIMPRSQCWCVDGKSKFAMRVALPDTYYRIELPGETPEDMIKVAEFEETLRKVLFYERTACPFARGFSIDLPPEEPVVRRRRTKSHGPAKKWRLARAYSWKPEDGEEPPSIGEEEDYTSDLESDGDPAHSYDSSLDETQSDASGATEESREIVYRTPTRPSVRERIAGLTALRSVTSPAQFAAQNTPPKRLQSLTEASRIQTVHAPAMFQDMPTAMPPSPPLSSTGLESAASIHDELDLPRSISFPAGESALYEGETSMSAIPDHDNTVLISNDEHDTTKDAVLPAVSSNSVAEQEPQSEVPSQIRSSDAEMDATAPLEQVTTDTEGASLPQQDNFPMESVAPPTTSQETPTKTQQPIPDDPYAQIRARIQARRSIGGGSTFKSPTRTLSSTSSLASTSSTVSRPSQAQRQALTNGLVHKAVSKFLGPPAALVAIMLRIADRFAQGAYAIDLLPYRTPEGASRRVPGSFDLEGSDVEDLDIDGDDAWDAGDFTVHTPKPAVQATTIDTRASDSASGQDRRAADIA